MKRYADQYYRFGPELVRIGLANPSLFIAARAALERYTPVVEKIIAGQPVEIDEEDIAETLRLMAAVERQAGDELGDFFWQLRRHIREPRLLAQLGLTVRPGAEEKDPARRVSSEPPWHFEPAPEAGAFLARRGTYDLRLSPTQAQLITSAGAATMELFGARAAPEAVPSEPLPGRSHYLFGHDPNRWRVNVPHHAKVRYRDVYPGVDVVYYGNQGELEFDFVVAPGADPDGIAFTFPDRGEPRISEDGSLWI
ncbi:MAG: hypothetical protein GY953_41680, partial [bacterium]|nr:hypothetical protein [bacterium]